MAVGGAVPLMPEFYGDGQVPVVSERGWDSAVLERHKPASAVQNYG